MKPVLIIFLIGFLLFGCSNDQELFRRLPAEDSGVFFSNRITPTDSFNIVTTEYIYNGGGVGIADFNNDGLQDLFFSGNQVTNDLYLNQGELRFERVSEKAGVLGAEKWSSGVSTVDINADGLMDVYVSATIHPNAEKRRNELFINQGMIDGVPVFQEMAAAYGLSDDGHGEHAAFFDYDKDGDLDLYILIDVIDEYPNRYRKKLEDGTHQNTDKFYRNDFCDELGHPVFTDVSKEAGISLEGYGLGLTVADINGDGWKDIYVTNDYVADDLLYQNNQDGTFTNVAAFYFKHTSNSAMGNDVADINNDGFPDFIALDMQPEKNKRKKLLAAPNNYYNYQFSERFSYTHQYIRNTLQINTNTRSSIGRRPFQEIGLYAGVSQTDWSWCPSLADFDNDGFRDLFVTNGFPKDVTDRDFMAFRQGISNIASPEFLDSKIPEVKISNYAYSNNGDLTFTDKTEEWGLSIPSFSNGAAYGDLDNDGDLDYVVNNINDSAFVYENRSVQLKPSQSNFLRIKFEGTGANTMGYGAVVKGTFKDGTPFYAENLPNRGYLSSVEPIVHVGLGSEKELSEVVIQWESGKELYYEFVKANQVLIAKETLAIPARQEVMEASKDSLFKEVSLDYQHDEFDFIDFNFQNLIPSKLSQLGPSLAVGDVNGDGLDDVYIAGSRQRFGTFLWQKSNGSFEQKPFAYEVDSLVKLNEEVATLLFDVDADGDLDLYVGNGGNQAKDGDTSYQDFLFVNDGYGSFEKAAKALPSFSIATGCVKAADYDGDGDLDLFVGGRNVPLKYPKATESIILRNDSEKGKVRFVNVTGDVSPHLKEVGMVTDALWTDVDNDMDLDLLLAMDLGSLIVFENVNGLLKKLENTGLEEAQGMWTSLSGGDFDNDGDIDYVVGNVGLNTLFKGNKEYPARIVSGDFDNNGVYDLFPFIYLPRSQETKKRELVPFNSRDDVNKQLNLLKNRFKNYNQYAQVTYEDFLEPQMMKSATIFDINHCASTFVENLGNGQFRLKALPAIAQFAPLNGILIEDFNGDQKLDILAIGNNFGNELSVGRYDAHNGFLLLGDGSGGFTETPTPGFLVSGDGKSLVRLIDNKGRPAVIAAQNQGPLKYFSALSDHYTVLNVKPMHTRISYDYKGKSYTRELYYGSSYLSQSSRKYILPSGAENITLR